MDLIAGLRRGKFDVALGAESRFVEVDALSIIVNMIVEHDFISILPIDAVSSLGGQVGVTALPGAPRIGFHLVWPNRSSAGARAGRIEELLAAPGQRGN